MITTEFLNEVAIFTNNKIRKVVLNEVYEINEFEIKRVDQQVVTLEYTVPNGSVEAIHLIQLKDTLDQVVSSNAVYVPITSDTLMLQTIRVEEG